MTPSSSFSHVFLWMQASLWWSCHGGLGSMGHYPTWPHAPSSSPHLASYVGLSFCLLQPWLKLWTYIFRFLFFVFEQNLCTWYYIAILLLGEGMLPSVLGHPPLSLLVNVVKPSLPVSRCEGILSTPILFIRIHFFTISQSFNTLSVEGK